SVAPLASLALRGSSTSTVRGDPPVGVFPGPPRPLSVAPLASLALWGSSTSTVRGDPRWGSFQAPRDRFRVRRSLRSLFGVRRLRPSVVTPGGGLSRPPSPPFGCAAGFARFLWFVDFDRPWCPPVGVFPGPPRPLSGAPLASLAFWGSSTSTVRGDPRWGSFQAPATAFGC